MKTDIPTLDDIRKDRSMGDVKARSQPVYDRPEFAIDEGLQNGKYTIMVLIPTHDMVPHQWAIDYANMLAWTVAAIGDRVNLVTQVVPGTYVHRAREQLLDEAMSTGCHYMLWIDSDMRFPPDALVRLLAHDEDVVGINYSGRGVPPRFIAIKRIGYDHREDGQGGKMCPTLPDSKGLEEVEAMGMGLVLMKARTCVNLPEDRPAFWFGYDKDVDTHMGEDVWFFRLLRNVNPGLKCYVDHDLSRECAHVGQLEYRVQHAEAFYEGGGNGGDHNLLGATDGDRDVDEQE
jgi:hypothetical protein